MQVEGSSLTDIVNSTMSHFSLPLFVVYWAIMYSMGIITVGQSASYNCYHVQPDDDNKHRFYVQSGTRKS